MVKFGLKKALFALLNNGKEIRHAALVQDKKDEVDLITVREALTLEDIE